MNRFLLPLLMFLPTFLLLIYYLSGGVTKLGANEFLVLAVLIILGTIGNFSIKSNIAIFNFLKGQDEDLSKNPENNQLAWNIWSEFNAKKEETKTQLNIPSFIEVFISEYKIDNQTSIVKRMKLIHTFASISILVGVLGTFIGLVITLAALNPSDIDKSILNVLGGVHTAFFTSIGGILFSIAINLHSKIRNSEQMLLQIMLKIENYIHQKDQKTGDFYVVEALGEVKNAVYNMGRAFLDVASLAKEFKTATENLMEFNDNFQKNTTAVSSLFGDMKVVTKAFNKKAGLIHDDFTKLFTYFNNQDEYYNAIKQSFEQTANDIRVFANYQSRNMDGIVKNNAKVQKAYETMFTNVQEAVQNGFNEMNGFFQNTTTQISQIAAQSESHVEVNKELAISIEKQMKRNQLSLVKQLKEVNEQNSEVKDSFVDAVKTIESYFTTNQWIEAIIQDLEKILKQNNETVNRQTKSLTQSFSEDIQKLVMQNSESAHSLNQEFQQYKKESEKMSGRLTSLTDSDKALQKSVEDLTNHIKSTNQLIGKINQPLPLEGDKNPVVNI